MPESRRFPLQLPLAVAVALPGVSIGGAEYLGLPHPTLGAALGAVVYGIAIIGAAFVLSWAAEAAQVDYSAGLALAVLALLAVLPEYAVDFVFSYQAGQVYAQFGECVPTPEGANPCSLALANMTGANRVLVGVGWPLVVLVATIAALLARRHGDEVTRSTHVGLVRMPRVMSAEVVFLGIATLYSLHLPLRSSITLVDAAVLVTIFAAYAWRLAKAPASEPDLQGTSQWVGELPRRRRKGTYVAMFLVAAVFILASAEHFATSLVEAGTSLGIDPFILVQWVAPLASESPELIIACLYALRLKANESLGTLLSSKVNQWTLLVGTIPLVFMLSATTWDGLPIDTHQRFELLITAAQSLFAVSILINLGLGLWGAGALFSLFMVQFLASILTPPEVNRVVIIVMSVVYAVLAIVFFVKDRKDLGRVTRDGLTTPFSELERVDEQVAASER